MRGGSGTPDWGRPVRQPAREVLLPAVLIPTQHSQALDINQTTELDLEFNTHIFKPKEGADILDERMNLIGWTLLLLVALFFVIEIYWVGLTITCILLGIYYGIAIFRWNQPEPLNGSFPFRLAINKHEIKLGEVSYPMNRVRITKLICYDYKGRMSNDHIFFAGYVKKSNGTWNHLWFKYEGKEYRLRFGIDSEQHSRQIEQLKKELGLK